MYRRDVVSFLLIAVVLGTLAVFAVATRDPEAPWIERAEAWPLVGPLAGRFRDLYVAPASPPRADSSPRRENAEEQGSVEWIPAGEGTPEVDGGTFRHRTDRVWIGPGAVVRRAPAPDAAIQSRVEGYLNPAVFERRGRWTRIDHGEHEGWVLPPEGEAGEPPLGSEPIKPTPVAALAADPERLKRASEILGDSAKVDFLGPYRLLTDDPDPVLRRWLNPLVARLEEAYELRYDLRPIGRAAETIVLFREEEGYRRFVKDESRLADLEASGHAGHGMVVLFRAGGSLRDVGETLIHEIAHLLNRRALGPQLQPWLDEGIAEDLSWSRVGEGGRLRLGTFGGTTVQSGRLITRAGGIASPRALLSALESGHAPTLPGLIGLDWESFVASKKRRLHYAQAGLWLRFLLDGNDARFRDSFLRFLAGTSEGQTVGEERLKADLGRDWPELQAGFEVWVKGVARQIESSGESTVDSEPEGDVERASSV